VDVGVCVDIGVGVVVGELVGVDVGVGVLLGVRITAEAEEELLDGFGSVTSLVAIAVLTTVPGVFAIATMATVAPVSLASVPRLQLTVLVPEQLPWLGFEETKLTCAGSVSDVETFVVAEGPALVTYSV